MQPSLEEATKRIFVLQILVALFVCLLFGMAYTPPITLDSAKDLSPFQQQLVNLFLDLRFGSHFPFQVRIPSTLILFLAVTIAPFWEELAFRGWPLLLMLKWSRMKDFMEKSQFNFWIVVLGINFLFGFWHKNYPIEWRLSTFFFGATWGWLAFRYRTIWPTIRLHYRWNIMLAIIEFYYSPYVREELAHMITFY